MFVTKPLFHVSTTSSTSTCKGMKLQPPFKLNKSANVLLLVLAKDEFSLSQNVWETPS